MPSSQKVLVFVSDRHALSLEWLLRIEGEAATCIVRVREQRSH